MVKSGIATATEWLGSLKNAQLHRIAISIGAQCSGTKLELKRGIEDYLRKSALFTDYRKSDRPLSLVSIDMGVRNMAYAHFMATPTTLKLGSSTYSGYEKPRLQAWRKLVISPNSSSENDDAVLEKGLKKTRNTDPNGPFKATRKRSRSTADAYSPQVYAEHAVNFIDSIVTLHNPTHIIIERQRFRSGGSSAVQDWSIRVGVLEGMLYAVLQSVCVEKDIQIHVEGILTQKVNRYWLAQGGSTDSGSNSTLGISTTGAAAKKAKINLVGDALARNKGEIRHLDFEIDASVVPIVDAFLSKWKKESANSGMVSFTELNKLDDLADCLLQGMAWIDWQTNSAKLGTLGATALSGSLLKGN